MSRPFTRRFVIRRRAAACGMLALVSTALAGPGPRVPPEAAMIGVNLSGAEFGNVPGRYAFDYRYPGTNSFDYFRAQGLSVIRLPFRWERIQPRPGGPLDEAELRRLDATVLLARERGLKLLLDVHNFGKHGTAALGTPELPNEVFADLWAKLAAHFASEPAVFAYGLMNEPVAAKDRWPAAAQAAIEAIRAVDTNHTISVCGGGFSGAHAWAKCAAGFPLRDPADKLIYEAHQYFDRDHSGRYSQRYDESGATPETGAERLQPFIAWLAQHHARGFIGEFGVPADDPRWLETLDRFIAEMKACGIGGTYWSAGPLWGTYAMSVEPDGDADRPQMEALALYAGDRRRDPKTETSYDSIGERMRVAGRRLVFNFRAKAEAYRYANPETTCTGALVQVAGGTARRFAYRHAGSPAYVGVGLYFGALDCADRSAFVLTACAEKPTRLDMKLIPKDGTACTARVQVETAWREIVIPFADFTGAKGAFDPSLPIEKIELQPAPDAEGNALLLRELLQQR